MIDIVESAKVYWQAAVNGVPIVLIVLGLVELTKRLGATGKALIGISMAIGLVFGSGYMISQGALSSDNPFGAWFGVIVYGLGMGLIASGIYDLAKNMLTKAIQQLTNK